MYVSTVVWYFPLSLLFKGQQASSRRNNCHSILKLTLYRLVAYNFTSISIGTYVRSDFC